MIHGYVRAGRPDEAKDVFISMQRSGQDAYAGWLAITNQLFAAGQQELAKQLISKRQSDWLPDADLYEHIIKCVLSDSEVSGFYTSSSESSEAPQSNSHQPEKALDIVHDMQVCALALRYLHLLQMRYKLTCTYTLAADHMTPACMTVITQDLCFKADVCASQKRLAVEVRHLNLILESYADNGAAQAADTLFRKMASGQYAPPNGKSTEALARVRMLSTPVAMPMYHHLSSHAKILSNIVSLQVIAVHSKTVCRLPSGGTSHCHSFKCALQMQAYITSGRDDFGEGLTRVFGLVNKLQVPITKRFRALLVEGSLMQNNLQASSLDCICVLSCMQVAMCNSIPACDTSHSALQNCLCVAFSSEARLCETMQDALDQFAALRTAGRLRGMMSVLPDHVLADLLSRLSTAGMPAELLRVLRAMQADERRMPSLQPDPSGRSFLTAWLPSRLLSAASLGFEGYS